ncbi:MAG TPA: S8 family serine peptidase [Oscillatoriales cyanobacterium M59_W2019_021]|nr:S8 family serine peptidase [Oscillatoriales cyanobacterium M4454_W2019_049]HIK52950.1 S8 family serine peptidase [Oscillatoriales cyanobacterium M59_W2019_021]
MSDRQTINELLAASEGAGVAEERVGTILQRGGEELLLTKLADRFTVCPAPGIDPEALAAKIGATQHAIVPGGSADRPPLVEFTVDPRQLDSTIAAARQLPEVAFVSHVYNPEPDPGTWIYLTDEIVIQFSEEVDTATRDAFSSSLGLQALKPITGIPNTFVYQVTDRATDNPVKIANRLMRAPQVLTAEPNIIVRAAAQYRPRDTLYGKQWYLSHTGGNQLASGSHIGVEQAWEITRGDRSIIVAVADDSVDLDHPDFQAPGKIVAPRDFKDNDFLPLPDRPTDNHGTSCAGVCVAEENGSGVVGVAPGCALMPIRTSGYLDDESVEAIFDWAMSNGASVISCSWGASAVYFPLSLRQRAAINRAATQGRNGKGCVVVFAAGNANRPTEGTIDERGWPQNVISGKTKWLSGFAVHPDVIAVSASTSLAKKAAYSNWGPNISVSAPSNNAPPGMWLQSTGFISTAPEVKQYLPGLGVFTADRLGAAGYSPDDYTSNFGGTSSACPVVAGVAALVLSANPDLTALQVKQILQQSADKILDSDPDPQFGTRYGNYDNRGHSQWFGYGKVNAYKAVQAAQQQLTTLPPVSRWIQGTNPRELTIPDGDARGVASGISVNDSSPVLDIQIEVRLAHDFLGDVEIYLVDPRNEAVLLQNRSLGRQTVLQARYGVANVPLLKSLLNRSGRGTWQLRVIDRAPQDTGVLKSWQLTLGL